LLENSHRAIADAIGSELKLHVKEKNLLIVGSINPDSWGDFPHHTGKEYEILAKIFKARDLHLKNDDECFAELGNALHYLEDHWTLRPRTAEKHTEWEYSIDKSPLLDDDAFLNAIDEATMPQKAIDAYKKLADSLIKIKNEGLESWFDPSWGIWHKRYEWMVESYVSLVEIFTRAMIEEVGTASQWVRLMGDDIYVNESYPKFHESSFEEYIDQRFLDPIVSGYQAGVWSLASLSRPSSWSSPAIDLNFAFRICLEVSRYTLVPAQTIKEDDDWSVPRVSANEKGHYLKGVKQMPDDFFVPSISGPKAPSTPNWAVISKPIHKVSEERRSNLPKIKDELLRIENASIFQTATHSEFWEKLLKKAIDLERQKVQNTRERE